MATVIRDMLAQAQAAEVRRDFVTAIALLQEAQAHYRQAGQEAQAERMGRQVLRLREAASPQPAVATDDFGFGDSLEDVAPKPLPDRGPTLTAPPDAWCSFCCRPSDEVAPLVAGPAGAFVCADCAGRSVLLLGGGGLSVASVPAPRALWSTQKALLNRWASSTAHVALLIGPAGVGKSVLAHALQKTVVFESPAQDSWPAQGRVVLVAEGVLPEPSLIVAGQGLYDTRTLHQAVEGRWPLDALARVDLVLPLVAPPQHELVTALAAQLDAPATQVERLVEHGLHHGPGLHEVFRLAKRFAGGR
jgi:hypothetical protein